MACMTDPLDRNSNALKKAWVNTWNTAAEPAATPKPMNIYPNCETVE